MSIEFDDEQPPYFYEQKALEFERLGKWKEAAQAWRFASDVSIGIKRSERYLQAAEKCKAQKARS